VIPTWRSGWCESRRGGTILSRWLTDTCAHIIRKAWVGRFKAAGMRIRRNSDLSVNL